MSDINMTSLSKKLQNLDLGPKSQDRQEVGYMGVLRQAIFGEDLFMEEEVLKSLGDLHLQKAKLSKDSAEFDKAAALYAAALLRCKDPDMGQTLEHRIGYMEKLSRQLLQGYTPHFLWLSPDYWGTVDSNALRVAEICAKLDQKMQNQIWSSVEEIYTKALVTAIENGDVLLEQEILKSLGDSYFEEGKKTFSASRLSDAAAMYNKALKICEGQGAKETLRHRIRHLDRVKEAMERKPSRKKSRPTELRRSRVERQLVDTTGTDVKQGQPFRPDIHSQTRVHLDSVAPGAVQDEKDADSQYKDHLKEGESSLVRANLDSAEQHFAAALRMVHIRDSPAQQYQREVEPLCKLGDVYSKRGQQTGDGGDFVKAAALYNAAIVRSEDQVRNGNLEITIIDVEKSFHTYCLGIQCSVIQDGTKRHKKQLKEMRDQIKLEMETIDQQLDPYVHDEDDPRVKQIEAKRAQAVRKLFENIAQQRKEFISQLVEECIGLMGPPPCKYALIGLGSQATGLVTPYSDLEFAILVEEESEEYLVYFRNLTHYLHLKVVNLGETILPALGIISLNNFYTQDPLDSWYYDSVTPRGFAFDASMPKASKTPLGLQGTMEKPPSELICTPKSMILKLQKDTKLYLREGYHLATILRNPCLIAGDQGLIDTYMAMTVEILQAEGGKMARQLAQETLKENIKSYDNKETITAKIIDVKKDIYRFPGIAVDCIALSSGVVPTTIWKTIEDMEVKKAISAENAHHLRVLVSISAELRLRTYIANGGQKENLSALASLETTPHGQEASSKANKEIKENVLKPLFHLPDRKQLFRYYYTALPLKTILSDEKSALYAFTDILYDNSPEIQGVMYSELCEYSQAISYLEKALKKCEDMNDSTTTMYMLHHLGLAWCNLGDFQKAITYMEKSLKIHRAETNVKNSETVAMLQNLGKAWLHLGNAGQSISYFEEALQMGRGNLSQTTEEPNIATTLNRLAEVWTDLGDDRKALSYAKQGHQKLKNFYGQNSSHPEIAHSLLGLGVACLGIADYKTSVTYIEQALQMFRNIYGQSAAHPNIASTLSTAGAVWHKVGDHRKAISYHEQAMQMYRSIYGRHTNNLIFSTLFGNLGSAWNNLGDYREALSCEKQALQILQNIHGFTKAHPIIAETLNDLGETWAHMDNHRQAIMYHEQALQMYKSIYGESTGHPRIAASISKLGLAWCRHGYYWKAISYSEQALKMFRCIFGHTKDHPDIAAELNNLGVAWTNLGDFRKAIKYHEESVEMEKSIHGHDTAHPDFAMSLSNLGLAWHHLCHYKKAISYYDKVLQICKEAYCTTHPLIANTLCNLGAAWTALGDQRKALTYHEQALQMNMSIYGEGTNHSRIATALNNIGLAWLHLLDYKRAISYFERALPMCRSVYGQTAAHMEVAQLLNNMGMAQYHGGEYWVSIRYLQEALAMARQIYPQNESHPFIRDVQKNLTDATAMAVNNIRHIFNKT